MNAYLSGVGFSNVKNRQALEKLMQDTFDHHSLKYSFYSEDGRPLMEYSKYYAVHCGLTVVGELDGEGVFCPEYAYPFYNGDEVSLNEEVNIEPQTSKDAYSAICEDPRMGISLIFYLSNIGEYCELRERGFEKEKAERKIVSLSGIAMNGTILLPLYRRERPKNSQRDAALVRKKMMNASSDEDWEAAENRAEEALNTYNMLSRRIVSEDILSIVETSLIPCGVECDQYNILGTIRRCETTRNIYSGDELYLMAVECNHILFNICVNSKDLWGEPEVGRRFKGRIWLQGEVGII